MLVSWQVHAYDLAHRSSEASLSRQPQPIEAGRCDMQAQEEDEVVVAATVEVPAAAPLA